MFSFGSFGVAHDITFLNIKPTSLKHSYPRSLNIIHTYLMNSNLLLSSSSVYSNSCTEKYLCHLVYQNRNFIQDFALRLVVLNPAVDTSSLPTQLSQQWLIEEIAPFSSFSKLCSVTAASAQPGVCSNVDSKSRPDPQNANLHWLVCPSVAYEMHVKF